MITGAITTKSVTGTVRDDAGWATYEAVDAVDRLFPQRPPANQE